MKVMAIASASAALTPDQIQKHLPNEVPATLRLYLDGTVEQFWLREKAGPIFLMNVNSVDQAKATLDKLPLVAEAHYFRIHGAYSADAPWPSHSRQVSRKANDPLSLR